MGLQDVMADRAHLAAPVRRALQVWREVQGIRDQLVRAGRLGSEDPPEYRVWKVRLAHRVYRARRGRPVRRATRVRLLRPARRASQVRS